MRTRPGIIPDPSNPWIGADLVATGVQAWDSALHCFISVQRGRKAVIAFLCLRHLGSADVTANSIYCSARPKQGRATAMPRGRGVTATYHTRAGTHSYCVTCGWRAMLACRAPDLTNMKLDTLLNALLFLSFTLAYPNRIGNLYTQMTLQVTRGRRIHLSCRQMNDKTNSYKCLTLYQNKRKYSR